MGHLGIFMKPGSGLTQNRYRQLLGFFNSTYFDFFVPSDFSSITKAVIPVSRLGADSSPFGISKYSVYSGNAESNTTHTESVTTDTYTISNIEDVVEVDISNVLTGIAANDWVGIGILNREANPIIVWNGIFEYVSSLGTPKKIATIQAYKDSIAADSGTARRNSIQMLATAVTYANLIVPSNFTTLSSAYLWFRHQGPSTGNKDIDVETRYGGNGEAFAENTESATITVNKTVASNSTYKYDISSVLTGISAGQSVGIKITNNSGISTYFGGGVLEYV